jgi:hypothetical protein
LWILDVDVLNHHIIILLLFTLVLNLVLRVEDLRILLIFLLFSIVR